MTSKQVQCIKKLVGKLFPVIKEEDLETDERRPIFLKNKIDNTVLCKYFPFFKGLNVF